ncbi:MAG: glycosyltransferase [Bacteroidota bacterium]
MKEVILYSPGAFQPYGHSFDYSKGLAEAFYDLGYVVYVFGFDGPLTFPETIKEERRSKKNTATAKKTFTQKVKWGVSRLFSSGGILQEFTSFYSTFKTKPLVIFETFEYFSLSRVVPAFSSNYFCVFHDTNFNFVQTSFIAGLYKYLAKIPSRRIVKHSITSFVHGSQMRTNFIVQMGKKYEDKIKAIPYGAPLPEEINEEVRLASKKEMGLKTDKHYLLSFGTLRSDKEYEPILEALGNTQDWFWMVAGPEGDYSYARIKDLAKQYNVEEKLITYPRFIKNTEQKLFFTAADLVINLYKPFIRHESGTAQLARTYNMPVVAGGPPDLTNYVAERNIGWVTDSKQNVTEILTLFQKIDAHEKAIIYSNIKTLAESNSWPRVVDYILGYLT